MSTSESPSSSAQVSTGNEHGSSSGFRSFWRRQSQQSQPVNIQFVQQNPGDQAQSKRSGKLGRLPSSSESPPSTNENVSETGGSAAPSGRRRQIYAAQKRHRDRKAEYTKSLEDEVARLQHLEAMVNYEKTRLARQNREMRNFLSSQSLDARMEAIDLGSSSNERGNAPSMGGVSIDIRYDPQIGQTRTFMDFCDPDLTLGTSSESGPQLERTRRRKTSNTPVQGDSWAALDFILALEWPCQTHILHAHINPDAKIPIACDQGGFHGHGLVTMQAVYQSAQPPRAKGHVHAQPGLPPDSQDKWQLPHSEIEKLVTLSEQLDLDDEQLTPAQAYSAVKNNITNASQLRPVLEALKKPLASLVHCFGFGAALPTDMFWQHFDLVMQNLESGLSSKMVAS